MNVYDLWLPIVLTGLATHILSTLAWTVLPHHRPEWQKHAKEDELLELLRSSPAGQFIFPYAASGEEMKSEAYKSKMGKCQGMLVLWATPISMGKAIGLTLLSFLVIAFVIGYVASIALPRGTEFMRVVQLVTTVGLLAHVAARFPNVFWFRRKSAMEVLDGVVFAIVTGLIFASLWPK
jgi:hypothetical protein